MTPTDGTRPIRLGVNGNDVAVEVPVRMTLADFLRHELRLTGTHLGCEHGVCGACTVLLDGQAVRSCLMLAVQADSHEVLTVEGISDGEVLNPLQEAFERNSSLQCGFCTAGFLMAATAFLNETQSPSEEQVRDAIGGNICRCTGYGGIVKAILEVANGPKVGQE